jgi:RNA polymerase sigma factor (sigma-70 family)
VSTDDDAALCGAWRGGDRAAGEALFERHFDALYRFFESKIPGDVGDLVQRTLLGCVEARERFRGDASFRTFLFAVARHELYGYYRGRQRNAALDFGVSSLADLAPGPSTALRRSTEREALLTALRTIPLDLQIAVELHYWEGLRGPELAAALEIPEGTVRSRLRRALEALRAALAAAGRPPAPLGDGDPEAALDAWAAALAAAALDE